MSWENFEAAPWRNSHDTYANSSLAITPAPEYASSEVLLSSLYRVIGFQNIKEGGVPEVGRKLEQTVKKLRDRRAPPPESATLGADTWNTVLHGVLESPKLPNQSSKRFLQVTPLAPSVAQFSGSARLSSNPWSPGSLIRRMIWLGSRDSDEAFSLWNELFNALGVNEHDDAFARWLEQEALAWGINSPWELAPVPESEVPNLAKQDHENTKFMPARQFTKDIRAIINAKASMTRRQWTSMLEAILRLATVTHVLWLCDVQARTWRCLSDAINGAGPKDEQQVRDIVFPENAQYMTYGGKALNGIRDMASNYLASRLGINAILWCLESVGKPYTGHISSSNEIAKLCKYIREHVALLDSAGLAQKIAELRDREARALSCSKGIGANLLEFARHALGKRQTAIQLLRGYDQGYILRKAGTSAASPWVVSLGPVAVLAFVHCALSGMAGPRSINRLGQHLAAYGIAVDRHDIGRTDLGHQLRMLGLVLDSPDAESGMLLLPPFPAKQNT